MNFIHRIWHSTVGKKLLMASTGCVLVLFVVGHLLGNLQIFLGPDVLNRYGHFLQTNMELIWPARLFLIACVVLHVVSAVSLTRLNRAARPVGYVDDPTPIGTSYASRTMMMSGLITAAFVVYHVLHYTVLVKSLNFSGLDFASFEDEKGRHDIFKMTIIGFQQPAVVLFYVIGLALLCIHLSHGIYAMFQSLGVRIGAFPMLPRTLARWGSVLIFAGYVAIPLAVLRGFGRTYTAPPPPDPALTTEGK
jgi:succinate dehydrogenase / fumarate reductase cytochrome b subunit